MTLRFDRFAFAVPLALLLLAPATADAAILVKIQTIQGDVTTQGYDDDGYFVADSFSFGVEREMKESGEKGGGATMHLGVADTQEVRLELPVSASSIALLDRAFSGAVLGDVELEITSEAGAGTVLEYRLERCFVKSWSISGDADDAPTIDVRLVFDQMAVRVPGADRKSDTIVGWDAVYDMRWLDHGF